MKKHLSTIFLIFVFIAGLSLLLYPTVSDYWNSIFQSQAIAGYTEEVAKIDDNIYEELWKKAQDYNGTLARGDERFVFYEEDKVEYENLLNVAGNGVMGYIQIPVIGCSLPIYHGTSDAVLQTSIGHITGTSLPAGSDSGQVRIRPSVPPATRAMPGASTASSGVFPPSASTGRSAMPSPTIKMYFIRNPPQKTCGI